MENFKTHWVEPRREPFLKLSQSLKVQNDCSKLYFSPGQNLMAVGFWRLSDRLVSPGTGMVEECDNIFKGIVKQ